ncbi:MAG: hypothetical protein JXR96_12250 [Deltaproteobacteria bacterium]|nr:hypothetical protein [Deltaproteobacteria bacterium]
MDFVWDASSLILLAKTTVLRELGTGIGIIISPEVKSECLAKPTFDAALIEALIDEGRIQIERPVPARAVRKLMRDFRIQRGEAEALWLARSSDRPLAVDDGPTIKACRILGVPFATALHFLIRLRSEGRLDHRTALVKLDKLVACGRYGRRIVEDARRRLEEE